MHIQDKLTRANLNKYMSSRILKNTGWLFFDKVCRLGVGLFVGIWTARYLGPVNFGTWNYAIAVVSILSALATLGLDQVLVKNLVEDEANEDILMGTAFLLRLTGSVIAIVISVCYVLFAQSNSALVIITFVTGLGLSFQCFDVIDLKFQSKLKSKTTVIIKNGAFLFTSLLKVFILVNKGGLMEFVIISLFEIFIGACGLIFSYGLPRVLGWRLDRNYAKKILIECWPLMLSGVIILMYMRLDQLMIGNMLDTKKVGLYSVSVRFSELWYFIPSVFVNSFFPKLIKLKFDVKEYRRLCMNLFKILFVISFSIAIVLSLSANLLISTLYGSSYIESAFALKISIWTAVFVFWGVSAGNMLVIENLNKHNLYKSIQGLLINALLNVFLIPRFGINGAAIATLMSQFYASYFYYFINKSTRHIFYMQSRSMLFFLKTA